MDSDDDDQRIKLVRELNDHIQKYPINLTFPASVSRSNNDANDDGKSGKPSNALRTDSEFVNLRLLESGVLFEDGQNLGEVTGSIADFVSDMKQTGCYNNVQVKLSLDKDSVLEENRNAETKGGTRLPCKLDVQLDEKKWYKLYIGGGIKHESMEQSSSSSNLPKVQFETNASLINLRGLTDNTTLSYSIDQTASSDLFLSYDAPLFSIFPRYSPLYNFILLSSEKGTETHFNAKAGINMDDYEWTRSYKQFNRGLQLTLSNRPGVADMVSGVWKSLTYNLSFRDILPRRNPTLPYACDASPDIVSQAGPNLKNSLQYMYRTNGEYSNDRFNPTEGLDSFLKVELAGPPGDTGFLKLEGGYAFHMPLFSKPVTVDVGQKQTKHGLTLHASLNGGIMKTLNFGGLCHNTSLVPDRFFAGGPLQLRGFQPSGIGPRAKCGGKSVAGGDSLGGEVYYATNLTASIPSPIFSHSGLRLFGFVNAGTLNNYGVPLQAFVRSSRISVGGGASLGSPLGRVELTYAVPIRYGPKDARKSVQLGFGLCFN